MCGEEVAAFCNARRSTQVWVLVKLAIGPEVGSIQSNGNRHDHRPRGVRREMTSNRIYLHLEAFLKIAAAKALRYQ